MATPTKTTSTLFAHAELTHPGVSISSVVNVATKFEGAVVLDHANIEATANASPVLYRIQTSSQASGDEDWRTFLELQTTTTAADTEAISGSEAGGQTVIGVAATAGFLSGQTIYIEDVNTVADGEWAEVENVVTNTSVDIVDGLTNAKDSSDFLWNQAERYYIPMSFSGVVRVRVVCIHRAATGSDIHHKADLVSLDSVA